MMKDVDLEGFAGVVKACQAENRTGPFRSPSIVLQESAGLFSAEIWRLSRSLRIGVAAREFEPTAAEVADHIWENLRDVRCAPLGESKRWREAVCWALARGGSPYSFGRTYDRQHHVGIAYKRLKQQGFDISLGAHGIDFSERAQKLIFEKADSLSTLLGGAYIINWISKYLIKNNKMHDGMWLLGDQVPNVMQTKMPTPPLAWLFALGARHLYRNATARKPEVAWSTLISLATDMAACLDCERYNQFEGMNVHASQFWRSMTDSLMWREFFTHPQVPAAVVCDILQTLEAETASAGAADCERFLAKFNREVIQLIRSSDAVYLGKVEKGKAKRIFPTLCKYALGKAHRVNASIDGIFSAGQRNHEKYILFECDTDHFVFFPSPLLSAAICEVAFTQVWKSSPSKAAKIIGNTMERALSHACTGKATILEPARKYVGIDGKNLEMDIGSRDDDVIVLIETKAKSLTSASRTAAGFSYIADYTKSYLAMIKQLMLHEKSIRNNCNPLVAKDEVCNNFKPLKVAVSPLSYGQLSDKMFASGIVRGMYNASLNVVPERESEESRKIIREFNDAMADVRQLVGELAPKRDGLAELSPFLLDFFWLDLGQALYVLKRAKTIADAFRPLSRITYSTRDFWTEVAAAERGGLTRDRWYPSA